ncbi:uncharacterized protein LOC143565492 [Bidens hawaiensis]|uniref:uncharacterized protein LOC143565492 n=1 Tax=Bidens hawaiensis TaxID=980011 RepID=UPI00404AD7C5
MGGKVDSSINRGNAPFVFILGGEKYHAIRSLLPMNGSKPKFSQFRYLLAILHILISEINNASTSSSDIIDLEIIQDLKLMLDSHNELVKSYRMARDCFEKNPNVDLKIRLIAKRQQDGRTYNLPTASEVATLIVGDIDNSLEPLDIIVRTKSGTIQRISELHPSYSPLQYPLLYPYGDDGYRIDILHRDVYASKTLNDIHAQ